MKTIVLKVRNLPKNVDTDLFVYCMQQDITASYPRGKVELVPDLLKEQEAVEPKLVDVNTWMCGKCGALLGWEEFSQFGLELIKYKYCPECGRHVKWE